METLPLVAGNADAGAECAAKTVSGGREPPFPKDGPNQAGAGKKQKGRRLLRPLAEAGECESGKRWPAAAGSVENGRGGSGIRFPLALGGGEHGDLGGCGI